MHRQNTTPIPIFDLNSSSSLLPPSSSSLLSKAKPSLFPAGFPSSHLLPSSSPPPPSSYPLPPSSYLSRNEVMEKLGIDPDEGGGMKEQREEGVIDEIVKNIDKIRAKRYELQEQYNKKKEERESKKKDNYERFLPEGILQAKIENHRKQLKENQTPNFSFIPPPSSYPPPSSSPPSSFPPPPSSYHLASFFPPPISSSPPPSSIHYPLTDSASLLPKKKKHEKEFEARLKEYESQKKIIDYHEQFEKQHSKKEFAVIQSPGKEKILNQSSFHPPSSSLPPSAYFPPFSSDPSPPSSYPPPPPFFHPPSSYIPPYYYPPSTNPPPPPPNYSKVKNADELLLKSIFNDISGNTGYASKEEVFSYLRRNPTVIIAFAINMNSLLEDLEEYVTTRPGLISFQEFAYFLTQKPSFPKIKNQSEEKEGKEEEGSKQKERKKNERGDLREEKGLRKDEGGRRSKEEEGILEYLRKRGIEVFKELDRHADMVVGRRELLRKLEEVMENEGRIDDQIKELKISVRKLLRKLKQKKNSKRSEEEEKGRKKGKKEKRNKDDEEVEGGIEEDEENREDEEREKEEEEGDREVSKEEEEVRKEEENSFNAELKRTSIDNGKEEEYLTLSSLEKLFSFSFLNRTLFPTCSSLPPALNQEAYQNLKDFFDGFTRINGKVQLNSFISEAFKDPIIRSSLEEELVEGLIFKDFIKQVDEQAIQHLEWEDLHRILSNNHNEREMEKENENEEKKEEELCQFSSFHSPPSSSFPPPPSSFPPPPSSFPPPLTSPLPLNPQLKALDILAQKFSALLPPSSYHPSSSLPPVSTILSPKKVTMPKGPSFLNRPISGEQSIRARKVAEIVNESRRKEEEALAFQFKAIKVPENVLLPQYENNLKKAEEARILRKNQNKTCQIPFGFDQREKEKQILKQNEIASEVRNVNKVVFKAREVPQTSKNLVYEQMTIEKEKNREDKVKKNAEENLQRNKMFPRMEAAEQEKAEFKKKQEEEDKIKKQDEKKQKEEERQRKEEERKKREEESKKKAPIAKAVPPTYLDADPSSKKTTPLPSISQITKKMLPSSHPKPPPSSKMNPPSSSSLPADSAIHPPLAFPPSAPAKLTKVQLEQQKLKEKQKKEEEERKAEERKREEEKKKKEEEAKKKVKASLGATTKKEQPKNQKKRDMSGQIYQEMLNNIHEKVNKQGMLHQKLNHGSTQLDRVKKLIAKGQYSEDAEDQEPNEQLEDLSNNILSARNEEISKEKKRKKEEGGMEEKEEKEEEEKEEEEQERGMIEEERDGRGEMEEEGIGEMDEDVGRIEEDERREEEGEGADMDQEEGGMKGEKERMEEEGQNEDVDEFTPPENSQTVRTPPKKKEIEEEESGLRKDREMKEEEEENDEGEESERKEDGKDREGEEVVVRREEEEEEGRGEEGDQENESINPSRLQITRTPPKVKEQEVSQLEDDEYPPDHEPEEEIQEEEIMEKAEEDEENDDIGVLKKEHGEEKNHIELGKEEGKDKKEEDGGSRKEEEKKREEGRKYEVEVKNQVGGEAKKDDNIKKSKVFEIIENCRKKGERFKDLDFPANVHSICKDPSHNLYSTFKSAAWLRPDAIFPSSSQIKLFDKIEPNDIAQGSLGDCYFLASCSAMAEFPERVKSIFVNQETNKEGCYGVKFFVMGIETEIIIDDQIPCTSSTSPNPLFTRPNSSELWVLLLEKAWAKLFSSYTIMEGGLPHWALSYLLGGTCKGIGKEDEGWKRIGELMEEGDKVGRMMCGGSEGQGEEKNRGIVSGHAYTIIEVHRINNELVLKMRNPWGSFEWNGDYGEDKPIWTPQLKAKLGYVKGDDGVFFMTFTEFSQEFNYFGISFFSEAYYRQNFPENTNKSCFYMIEVKEKTVLYAEVHQRHKLLGGKYLPVEMLLFNLANSECIASGESQACFGNWSTSLTECLQDLVLEKGKYLLKTKIFSQKLVIPSCTSFYSSRPLSLNSLSPTSSKPLFHSLLLSFGRVSRKPIYQGLKIYNSISFFPEMSSFVVIYVGNEEKGKSFEEKAVFWGAENVKRRGELVEGKMERGRLMGSEEEEIEVKVIEGEEKIVVLRSVEKNRSVYFQKYGFKGQKLG